MTATDEPSILEREDLLPSTTISSMSENTTANSDSDSDDESMKPGYEPRSFANSDIVNVIVGSERTVFKLHRQVLMEKSPFFQKCLTSGMIEEHTNKVILPEDSPRAFDLVAEWVYSARLLLPRPGWKYDSITLMGAWVLADKYCIPHLQNAVIDSLAGYWSVNWMNPDHLSWAADHTDNESPLYRLALDEMAHDLHYYSNLYPDSNVYRPPEINEDYSEALERVVARPFLSNRLLFKTLGPFHEEDPPAESPQNYHVPTKLLIGGTTSTIATN